MVQTKIMIILGIDPGTSSVGYAIIETSPVPRLIESKLVPIAAKDPVQRLLELHNGLKSLLIKFRPKEVSLEKLFFSKNTKTALSVSEARGVILLTTALAGVAVSEYTPLEVKKAVTGDGKADKDQVKKMIQLTLREAVNLKARDDVFDAIGVALTCYYRKRFEDRVSLAKY